MVGFAIKSWTICKIYGCSYVLTEARNLNVVAGVPKKMSMLHCQLKQGYIPLENASWMEGYCPH
jgi:hypothetical protein